MNTDAPYFETIAQLIFHHYQYRPNAIAIAAPNQLPLSYADLYKQIQQTVDQLNELGLGRGDRVAIILPNGPEMAVAFLAIAATAISAPLNPAYQEPEFDFYFSDLEVKAVIVLAGMASPARKSATKQQIPVLELVPQPEAAGLFHLTGTLGSAAIAPTDACPEDIALILHTSGTTSRPKMVPLTQANLCYSAQTIQTTLTLTENDRSLNIMPLFHIHGLVGVLLSSLAGGGCVTCSPGFVAGEFFHWWTSEYPTWYSAVPTLHQAILEQAKSHKDIIARYPLRFIRSSSASLPPLVLKQLEQTFNAPVIEAYGMTEAAHQIASNPLPPARRCPGSVGLATRIDIAIMNEQGNLMPAGDIGEVVIRGTSITPGYLNNPEANAEAFYQGWFRTGDRGYLDEQGYLFLRGRLKEIINRGGEKVAPQEVDEVLMEYPGVLQAVTFVVPHPTLGEDVAAAVVPRQGAALSNMILRQWLFQRLAAYKIPSQVVIVETIPKGATGKLQRIGLAQKLADVLVQPYCPPRNEIEQSIATIMTEVLGIALISIFDNFFGLGGDSLTGSQVISRVRDRLHLDVPLQYLFGHPTIAEFASAIERLTEQKAIVKAVSEIELVARSRRQTDIGGDSVAPDYEVGEL